MYNVREYCASSQTWSSALANRRSSFLNKYIPIAASVTARAAIFLIENAFGCRVFDQYGCAELSVFGAEGQCGQMHVSSDYGIVEIVDDAGGPVPPGSVGHLVCTGLINDAQVLLRYRTGDMAAWGIDSCKCGSALPVLASIAGRSTDALLLEMERKVFRVGTVAERIACIKEYQIIQDDIGLFTLNVVVSGPLHDFETKELIENLQAHVRISREH